MTIYCRPGSQFPFAASIPTQWWWRCAANKEPSVTELFELPDILLPTGCFSSPPGVCSCEPEGVRNGRTTRAGVRGGELPRVLRDISLCHWICWQPRGAEVRRFGRRGAARTITVD